MIEGVIRVTGAPVLALQDAGHGQEVTVDGILDTGFDGFVCLPIPIARFVRSATHRCGQQRTC